MQFDAEYDSVIVEAGSAGCVLANRLSADPLTRVPVVEEFWPGPQVEGEQASDLIRAARQPGAAPARAA